MIEKQCQFAGRDDRGQYLHILRAGYDNNHLVKLAAASPPQLDQIQTVMRDIPRANGVLYTLVSALGAGEYYGSNSNADYFGIDPLLHVPPGWSDLPLEQQKIVGKNWEWGYPTFYNAFPYLHHANKDPNRAFGSIEYAMWDPLMKRVLLIVGFDRAKAAQFGASSVIDRVENGEFPSVSMGCFAAGTPILMADGCEADIEVIREGDYVKTHRGRDGRVAQIHTRQYSGVMYDVKVHGHRRRLRLTDEHPLFVVGEEQLRCRPHDKNHNRGRRMRQCTPVTKELSKGCVGCETTPTYEPTWVRADELQVGDRLLFPVPSDVDPTLDDPQLMELLGYYLAEGFTHNYNAREKAAVTFCLSVEKQPILDRILELKDHFDVAAYSTWDDKRGKGRFLALLGCERLAALCEEHCGKFSKRKHVSTQILHASPELQKVFLGAYWKGDGGYYRGTTTGLYFSTASEELANQLFVILARCGVISSVNKIRHIPSKNSVVQVDTTEFQVWVGKQFVGELAQYCGVEAPELKTIKPYRFFLEHDGTTYIASPVEEILGEQYDGTVHNFAVDGDDSYVAAHLSVHNCRVPYDLCSHCADWSRITLNPRVDLAEHRRKPIRGLSATTGEYCTHLKNELNKIYPDGRRVMMLNMHPRFFDLSVVFIGADKTSFVLAKLAMGQCPIKLDSPICKQGCTQCNPQGAVPSYHIHNVWNRGVEKTAGGYSGATLSADGKKLNIYETETSTQFSPTKNTVWDSKKPDVLPMGQPTFFKHLSPGDQKRVQFSQDQDSRGRQMSIAQVTVPVSRARRAEGLRSFLKDAPQEKTAAGRDQWGGYIDDPMDYGPDVDWDDQRKEERQVNAILKKHRGRLGRVIKTGAIPKDAEILKKVKSNFRQHLPTIERDEPDLPVDDMDKHNLPDILGSTGAMGIVVKPHEFQRMFIRRLGRPGLADELDRKRLMFRTGGPPDDTKLGDILPDIVRKIMPLIRSRSAMTPSIAKRVMVAAGGTPECDFFSMKADKGVPDRVMIRAFMKYLDTRAKMPSGCPVHGPRTQIDDPLMDKIGSAYAGYRRDLLYKAAGLIKQAAYTHPQIAHALFSDDVDPRGIVKEGGDVVESMIGMLSTMYLNEAHTAEPVSGYVQEHSDLAGLQRAGGLALLGGVA